MSSIASKGLSTPMFQAASGKGDGGGNGSGGMYFGGGEQEPDQGQQQQGFRYTPWDTVDTKDITYNQPNFGQTPLGMGAWKLALAKILYEQIKNPPLPH